MTRAQLSQAQVLLNVNWDSPKLEFYVSAACGKGVRAREAISRGESVGVFGGHIVPLTERGALPAELSHFYFQVSDDLILTHTSMAQVRSSKIEFINHSCEPNVGFNGQIELVAMMDISEGSPVTFDYALCTSELEFEMECFCGSHQCRKSVTGNDWKIFELQQKYGRYFQPYLIQKIRAACQNHLR